tara:strand:- start:290 stop:739 length:450 start_codon:yes stop_codon:yes gene_type:complete
MYLKIENENIIYPYTISDLKVDNPNISFPTSITNDTLEDFNVYPVTSIECGSDYTKNYEEVTPIISGSIYIQVWNESNASTEEISTKVEEKWLEIRELRDTLLTQSDWTQYQDSPITGSTLTEWQTYRQGLRDITSQENPYSLNWPARP